MEGGGRSAGSREQGKRSLHFRRLHKEVRSMAAKRALSMHPDDNVATAVEEIGPGDLIQVFLGKEVSTLTAAEAIPYGFKMALREIPKGGLIVKYGGTIGRAGRAIARGELVHVHNLEGTRARGDLERRKVS
jgi:altronate dehydratase small subunit